MKFFTCYFQQTCLKLVDMITSVNFFLRRGAFVLASILAVYFGKALELDIFPYIFKTAKVIPIFKSGNKDNLGNYCPIALLPKFIKNSGKIDKKSLYQVFL